jgi:Na+/H+ antiporter NhaA
MGFLFTVTMGILLTIGLGIQLTISIKSKKLKLMVLETRRDKASYQKLYGIASQVLKGINLKIFFPRTGFWCKDCEYAKQCQAWRGN